MEIKRSFVKMDDKYAFITIGEDFDRVEKIDKKKAKEVYEQTLKDKMNWLENSAKVRKALKEAPEKSPELEAFIEMLQKAQKYQERLKLEDGQKQAKDMLERIDKQIHDMEVAIPELKRK